MTDLEIITALQKNGTSFALSLVDSYQKWGKWTPRQRVCAERIWEDANAPKPVDNGSFKGIVDMFGKATQRGLKRPALHFIFDGAKIVLSKAPEMKGQSPHPNAGYLYLKYGGQYCGKITPTGVFDPMRTGISIPESATNFLKAFALDPAKIGSEYGRTSGCCCFCGLRLSDGRSLAKGYGPVCADHWELPWGEEAIDNLKKTEQSDLAPDVPIIELISAAKRG